MVGAAGNDPQDWKGAAMHGFNLSMIPDLLKQGVVKLPDTNPGRMRNLVELDDASMFATGMSKDELRNLMRRLSARISREPDWPDALSDDVERNEDNPNIPSGYTYLLQFMAHDMVSTSISLAATDGPRFGFENARQLPLTLDTIFGGGPDISPRAYEFSQLCGDRHGAVPRTRLRRGRSQDQGSTAGQPLADVGRATPLDVADDGLPAPSTLATCLRTEALLADPRNDDQALVAQITVLFHRLHNFILAQLETKGAATTAPEAYRNFICARFILTLIYRRIILHDVLCKLLDPSVFRYYVIDKKPLVADDGSGFIPVEFSNGAFRCGHAMIRNSYRVNTDTPLDAGRALQLSSQRSPGFLPLTKEWVIVWERFFKIDEHVRPNYSRRLGPNFAPITRSEFYFAPLKPNTGGNGDAAGLPNRDLVSAMYARMPSVPKLIAKLRSLSPEIAAFLPDYDQYKGPLTTWLEATADPDSMTEQFLPGDVQALADDPPLPFFVLFEAALNRANPRQPFKDGGRHLGPLGSIIVAETIMAAMAFTPLRVGKLLLDPRTRLKSQADLLEQLGVTDDALSKFPELDSMEELLIFMQSNGLLDGTT